MTSNVSERGRPTGVLVRQQSLFLREITPAAPRLIVEQYSGGGPTWAAPPFTPPESTIFPQGEAS